MGGPPWVRWGRREAAGNEGHVGEAGPARCRANSGGPKFAHQESDGDRLKLPPMTKQRAIPTHHHRAGISKQGFGGVAGGRCLPVVATESADPKYDLRNFLLGRARAMTVEGLQHPAQPSTLLPCQSGVGRYGAAMEGGEQAGDRLEPVEAFQAERDEGAKRFGGSCLGRMNKRYALTVSEIENQMGLAADIDAYGGVDRRLGISACGRNIRRWAKNDGACVFLGKPDHLRFGRCLHRV